MESRSLYISGTVMITLRKMREDEFSRYKDFMAMFIVSASIK